MLVVDDHTSIEKTLSFHPRIGRDINFSPSLGLQVDLGPALLLYQENKDNSGMEIETHGLELSWSASIGLFYKI